MESHYRLLHPIKSSSSSSSNEYERTDLISELPLDIKDMILEKPSTRDAARAAVLSSRWNHAWLHHGRLAFDLGFFEGACRNGAVSAAAAIDVIFSSRATPVKKFYVEVCPEIVHQSDIDRWCLFLSKHGIQQLFIYVRLMPETSKYNLPECMMTCPTITHLSLYGFVLRWPENARRTFPNAISLDFREVLFCGHYNKLIPSTATLPKLQDLVLSQCNSNFEVNAPNLVNLFGYSSTLAQTNRLIRPSQFLSLRSLKLPVCSLYNVSDKIASFPIAVNLKEIVLFDFSFTCVDDIKILMSLLEKSPNLRHIEINPKVREWYENDEATLRYLKNRKDSFIDKDMKMLKIVRISLFRGSRIEMLFIKSLLTRSPVLDIVSVTEDYNLDYYTSARNPRVLLTFPRASPKAHIRYLTHMAGLNVPGVCI